MRNFANKIWNASRFVMMNLSIDKVELPEKLELEDKWILSKLNTLIREVTDNLEAYELGVASAKIYDFIWDTYCDWYIELTKTRLNGTDEDAKLTAQNVLCYVLVTLLKLLHPFMPFITEEIYQALPKCDGAEDILMTAQWPEYTEALSFPAEESAMEAVMDRSGPFVPAARDECAPLQEGGADDRHRSGGAVSAGAALHPASGLRQQRHLPGDRSGRCDRPCQRGDPRRHRLPAPSASWWIWRQSGSASPRSWKGEERSADHRGQAGQQEIRGPRARKRGERRA